MTTPTTTTTTTTTRINVLYLGMDRDIMAPMLLVPDFDNLFVISRYYETHGWTIKTMQNDLKKVLTEGQRFIHEGGYYFGGILPAGELPCPHKLPCTAEILEDNQQDVWRLKFKYNGKIRNLIYFFEYDFYDDWPEEITNIGHVLWLSAFRWDNFITGGYGDYEHRNHPKVMNLATMLETRTISPWFYSYDFMDVLFPYQQRIYDGKWKEGTKIVKIHFDRLMKNTFWWKNDFEVSSGDDAHLIEIANKRKNLIAERRKLYMETNGSEFMNWNQDEYYELKDRYGKCEGNDFVTDQDKYKHISPDEKIIYDLGHKIEQEYDKLYYEPLTEEDTLKLSFDVSER